MFSDGLINNSSTMYVKSRDRRLNVKTKRNNIFSGNKKKIGHTKIIINFPDSWKIVLLETGFGRLVMYLYGSNYYFKLSIHKKKTYVNFDNNSRSILISTLCDNNFFRLYWYFFRRAIRSFYVPFFIRIKFKGKGYYIFKNTRQVITPQFGHSHRLYVYSYFVSVVFLSKTSIFLFGLTDTDTIKVGGMIKSMRTINIFTGRGVRFVRQIIYKKVGKVSSYR
jgi:ribosomal protein L6P/L9E